MLRPLNCTRLGKRNRSKQGGWRQKKKAIQCISNLNWCNVHILEVPKVSLSGWQSGKRGKYVFQNQLSMLLVPRENLRGKQTNSDRAWMAQRQKAELTALTSLRALSCRELTFSTKKGQIPSDDNWWEKMAMTHTCKWTIVPRLVDYITLHTNYKTQLIKTE